MTALPSKYDIDISLCASVIISVERAGCPLDVFFRNADGELAVQFNPEWLLEYPSSIPLKDGRQPLRLP